MFGDPSPNRRMTPKEFEDELQESRIWGHIPRTYIKDKPFYTNLPIVPKVPFVNFDLGFK